MKVRSLISQADHQSNGLADHVLSGVKDPSVQTSHKKLCPVTGLISGTL